MVQAPFLTVQGYYRGRIYPFPQKTAGVPAQLCLSHNLSQEAGMKITWPWPINGISTSLGKQKSPTSRGSKWCLFASTVPFRNKFIQREETDKQQHWKQYKLGLECAWSWWDICRLAVHADVVSRHNFTVWKARCSWCMDTFNKRLNIHGGYTFFFFWWLVWGERNKKSKINK